MSKIPAYNIYIGDLASLETAKDAGFTHIVSLIPGAMPATFNPTDFAGHLHIEMDDNEVTNIMTHFTDTNKFIHDALSSNKDNKVLVHCVAGMSRSVTIVLAYLLLQAHLAKEPEARERLMLEEEAEAEVDRLLAEQIAPARGLSTLPNESFREQLIIYARSGCDASPARPLYRQWELRQQAATGVPPEAPRYVSAISREAGAEGHPASILRCKKCRTPLAASAGFILHTPADPSTAALAHGYRKGAPAGATGTTNMAPRNGMIFTSSLPAQCMQYFMEPVKWMRPELEKGLLEGKLGCPKCAAKVGSYSWRGGKCSCGVWVTPAIEIQRARVDEVRI